MLHLVIKKKEFYDGKDNFIYYPEKDTEIVLEHSLVSLSKWEAKWHKPFLKKRDKELIERGIIEDLTLEEQIDYIRCMTITQNVDPKIFNYIDEDEMKEISNYIQDSMSATTITVRDKKKNNEVLTSEVIYYFMASYQIPFSCEKWHLNRLLKLIEVCNVKNSPSKKRPQKDVIQEYSRINEANKAKFKSKKK